jgi:hypothetical protein
LSLKANYSQLNKDFIKAVENFYEKKIYRRGGFVFVDYEKYKQIKPEFNYRGSIPKEVVDSDIVRDYMEACLVLGISTRASSALSRRCLQNIIEKNTNIKSVNLNKQIDSLIESQNLPSSITDLLHAAREIGNISVHPIKDLKSNEIIETDIEEAELILDIIESLFDYYYVMPAKNSERKNRLNKKLSDAGRDTV